MKTQAEILEASNQHLMSNYGPPLRAMVRGAGARVWDADGKEYLDFFAGFGAGGVAGHCHPSVVAAIKDQADKLLSHGNFFTNEPQVELAAAIKRHAFGGKVFFCHSGAEANEAALKLARLASGPGRYKIISFNNCFHGRTMGGLSLTPKAKQEGFEPMLPGNVKVDYGDLAGVEAVIDPETAGVFVEPIQGEGGVNIPTVAFMQGLRKLCTDKDLVLVCDEVWTAPARTGKWFAYQHYGIEPDVMTLAKALGGGTPVAACVASPKYADTLGPGKHGCTMGGNPLCAAAGLASMKLIEEQKLNERATKLGERAMAMISDAKVPCVKAVRGKGLMIGIELDIPNKGPWMTSMEHGLLVCVAGSNIIRLAPPLVIEDELLEKGVQIFIDVLRGAAVGR